MAGRPCQPTNPPPKCYKPSLSTKSRQSRSLQHHDINPKITSPYYGAGTQSHVATYSHNLTNTRKPTMTPPTISAYPTLSKNTKQNAIKIVFKKFIIRNANSPMQAPTTPSQVDQLPVNCNKATPTTAKQTTSSIPTPTPNDIPPKIENHPRTTGQPKTEQTIIHSTPPCPSNRNIRKNLPTNQPNPNAHLPSKLNEHHRHSKYLSHLLQPTTPSTPRITSHQVHKSTESTPPNKQPPTDILTILQIETPPKQGKCNPLPTMPLYPQHKFHSDTPLSDTMTQITPTLKIQPILSPNLPNRHAIKPPQTMMELLRKQFEITQTLIDRLSRMLLPHNVDTSTNIMSQTLFDLIAALPPNELLTMLTTPPRTTLPNILVGLQPTHCWYRIPPKLSASIKTSTDTSINNHYHLSKTILWSTLSLTFLYSKDLQKVP